MERSARPASTTPPPQEPPDPLPLLGLLETVALAGSPADIGDDDARRVSDHGPTPVSPRQPPDAGPVC
ncbi:hypothetical protein [Spirillospora sp. NPDC047279]|uniref:hypothetical protein n=1 Tax=Spirillospora sp. NPDC047279 TaxID=3155478 RepID=UPI003403DB2D